MLLDQKPSLASHLKHRIAKEIIRISGPGHNEVATEAGRGEIEMRGAEHSQKL
jgi:hypothetical protein